MQSAEPAKNDAGIGNDETEPVIYLVIKGYGRGLRVFKLPSAGDQGR